MKSYIYTLLFWCLAGSPAFAEVHVAEKMRFEILKTAFHVNAGSQAYYDIGSANVGDRYEVSIQSTNGFFPDISAYVCLKGGAPQDCLGFSKREAPYIFTVDIKKPGAYVLQFDNSYSALTNKKGFVSVNADLQIDSNTRAGFEKMFQGLEKEIFSTFNVTKFNLALAPCGAENAFSTHVGGHVVICSELFMRLIMEQKSGAIMGIFFHELGHSLLNLWGQPNWANEETVDEFAITMMYWEGTQEKAYDWVAYFEAKNSVQEASHIIQHGDTHPLSVQRARNAREIMRNPTDVIRRWNKFLYPYLTSEKLRSVVDNPGRYGDRALASNVLKARAN